MELKKALMNLTIYSCHIISRYRGEILPKYQRQIKTLKEKKEILRNQKVSKMGLLHTSVHSDEEAISTDLMSRKRKKVSGTSSAKSN